MLTDKQLEAQFSSKTDEWETPQELFDALDAEHHFGIDVCATSENAKCQNFFSKKQDGLSQNWGGYGTIWCNPPYGRQIGLWVKKAYEAAKEGETVVMLLPARTDTRWFHDYCVFADVRFIRGRLKFGGSKQSAPFPSMIVIFGGKNESKT